MKPLKPLLILCIALSLVACRGDADAPSDQQTLAKNLMIDKGCSSCHRLTKLTAAKGMVGPPLDNMATQSYIAGVLPNTRQNLAKFIFNPQQFHANTAMPKPDLTWDEAQRLSDYLWNN